MIEAEKILPKIGFYYPGQNSYKDGSENLFAGQNLPFNKAISLARDVLGEDIDKPWVKPVVLLGVTVGLAATFAWYINRRPQSSTALSMGEVSSLILHNSLNLEAGINILKVRGQRLSEDKIPETGLYVVSGLQKEQVEEAVSKSQFQGLQVDFANWNSFRQSVIGGWIEHLRVSAKNFVDGRVMPVEGINNALHTKYVYGVAEKFRQDLQILIQENSLRSPMGEVFSAMRMARGLSSRVESSQDTLDVISNQVDSKIYQPPVLEELIQSGVTDLYVFDITGRALRNVKDSVGDRVKVTLIKDEATLIKAAEDLVLERDINDHNLDKKVA